MSIFIHSIDQGLLTIIYVSERVCRFLCDFFSALGFGTFVEFVTDVRFAGTEMTRTDKS